MSAVLNVRGLRGIAVITTFLILAIIGGATYIGYEVQQTFRSLEKNWDRLQQTSDQKGHYLTQIEFSLGYNGFIHHYKNMLLTRNPDYFEQLETDFDALNNSLSSYMLLDINEDEKQALLKLKRVAQNYQAVAAEAYEVLKDQEDLSPYATLDKSDQTAVITGLQQLRWAWAAEAKSIGSQITDSAEYSHTLTKIGSIFLPALGALACLVVWLVVRLIAQIGAYMQEKQALELSEQKFHDIVASVPGVIFQWYQKNADNRGYQYVSPRANDILGVSAEELRSNWQALNLHPDDETEFHKSLDQAIKTHSEWKFEGRFMSQDGLYRWGRALSLPVVTQNDDILFNGIIMDVTQQKELEEKLRVMATTDALTGAFNRRFFTDTTDIEIIRSLRHNHPMALCMLDIDHFKAINDTHTHLGGDAALKQFVSTVKSRLRATDTLGRLGGEEFGILLPETDLDGALHVLEDIRQTVEAMEVPWEGQHFSFTVSAGVTILDQNDTHETVLTRADQALYFSKNNGRNCVSRYLAEDSGSQLAPIS